MGCCIELVLSQRPVLDVLTCWNSVYLMLVSTILYKNVFGHLALRDSNFEQILPSNEDWRNAKVICDFLKPFYDGNSKIFFFSLFLFFHSLVVYRMILILILLKSYLFLI